MRQRIFVTALTVLVAGLAVLAAGGRQAQKPVELPKPGVPEIMTIEGNFIRAAYNNEGYVILGYRVANGSLGEEWMMLEVGTTMRQGKPNYTLQRTALSLSTPDGAKIPMATNEEYLQVNLVAVQNRLKVQHDSIDYFPPTVNRGGRIGFFSDLGTRTRAYDQVELSQQVASVGRDLLQDSWRDQIRPALLERAAQGKSRAGAVSNPDRRGGEVPHEELSGHPRAGSGSVHEEVEHSAIACEQDRDLVGPGRERNFNRAGR